MERAWDVRQARPEAGEAAALLLARFFAEEGFATPPDLIQERTAALLSSTDGAVFLAWDGAAAVGVATVATSFGIEFGRSAELDDLYVLPSVRGHGVARALIAAARAWAQRRGCTVLLVTVTPEAQAAHDLVRFYRRLGFRDDGRKLLSTELAPL